MGRYSFCITSQHAVEIHDIKCEAIFCHPMTTLKFGGLWDPNGTISWDLVFMQVHDSQFVIFRSSCEPSIFSFFHFFGKLILALRYPPAFFSIVGFSQLCQAKAKYCVTMVEEEKAAGGKAKENYVASPFSTTWAVSLSCEVLQHTIDPRRSCNIFNTQTQAKETDRLYSTEVKNGPSTKNLETYLYFGEQTKAAVIPLHCGEEIPNQKLNQSRNK